jgi:hypothetical protein
MPLASFLLRESFVPRRSPPCVSLTPFRNIVRARRLSRRRLSSRRLSSGCLSSRLLSSGCLSFSFGCCQHRRGRSDAECYTCSQDSQHPPAREHFHCSYLAHVQPPCIAQILASHLVGGCLSVRKSTLSLRIVGLPPDGARISRVWRCVLSGATANECDLHG